MDVPELHYSDYQTRLGAYAVVVDDQDRLLLALWNEADRALWTLPGGGVELPETVEEGVVRELREETGYDVTLGRLLGVDTIVIPPEERTVPERRRGSAASGWSTRPTVVGGELTAEVDGSTDEARWFPLAEVADLDRVELVDVGAGPAAPRPAERRAARRARRFARAQRSR